MSNLLKDASILLTPTAYENGRMNAIKPYKDLYGPELVTNGDFATDSDWIKLSNTTISGGKANFSNAGTVSLYQNISTQTEIVKVVFSVTNYTSGTLNVYSGGNQSVGNVNVSANALGTYTAFVDRSGGNNNIIFGSRDNFTGSIDNVSVVEDLSGDFTFSRNSAATRVNAQGLVENVQIISPELVSNGNFSQIGAEEVSNGNFSQEGSELVTNGDFATDSDWIKLNSTISGGKGNLDGDGQTSLLWQDILTQNKSYKVTFTISNYNELGNAKLINNEGVSYYTITSNGTFTAYFQHSDASGNLLFRATSGAIYSIDNVSVKEVGQDWILTQSTIGNEEATIISTDGSYAGIKQNGVFDTSKIYFYSFNVKSITGTVQFRAGTNGVNFTTTGLITGYIKPTSSGTLEIKRIGGPLNATITNISVKEVGQDWTFGTGVIVGDGFVEMDDSAALQGAQQTGVVTNGSLCRVTFTVQNYINGIVNLRHPLNENVSANGTYTFTGNANDTKLLIRGNDTTNDFEVTNISVKEITDDTDLPRINYEGFSYQDVLGSELITNGDFATDLSSWINGNSYWQWSSQGAYHPLGSVNNGFQQSFTTQSNKLTFSVEIISGALAVEFGGVYTFNKSGVYTIYGTTGVVNFKRSGSLECYIDNVSVKKVLGQEVVPDSGCGSWLMEGQSTNLVTYSEDISQSSWLKINGGTGVSPSITSNYAISPDGTQNASRVILDAPSVSPSSLSMIRTNVYGLSNPHNSSISFYVKSNTSDNYKILAYNGSLSPIEVIANNSWQRIELSTTVSTASDRIHLGLWDFGGILTDSYADISIWGAQLENQSYATSYIPTNGAASTRLQDIATNSGNSTLINSTEGVLYAEIAALADDSEQ